MNSSFFNGVSGIKTHQFGLDVWANNISNINKVGFKSDTPEFSSIYYAELTNNYFDASMNDKGTGSRSQTTSSNLQQGSFIDTESNFDLAIQGDGWFGVQGHDKHTYYTRAGQFSKDVNGNLVDAGGNYLTGSSIPIENNQINRNQTDINLETPDKQTKIYLPDNLILTAESTSEIDIQGNLNPEIIKEVNPNTGLIEEVSNIEVFRTEFISHDGQKNSLEVTFTKKVPQIGNVIWDANVSVYDEDKQLLNQTQGVLTFNGRGALLENTIPATISNGDKPITLNFGSLYDPNIPNSGFDGMISFIGSQKQRVINKDGHEEGNLRGYSVDIEGNIIASFDNSRSLTIAKIALYNFQNDQGLEKVNPIHFKESANSGKPLFFTDDDGELILPAKIYSNKLETSNVSLDTALTELIVMQKAFDANAKSITTSDELIQNAINMKK